MILHYVHTEFNMKLSLATPVVLVCYIICLSVFATHVVQSCAVYTQNSRAGYPKVIIESENMAVPDADS